MKSLSPLQVNLNWEGKRHVLYTWQCLHCQECVLDEYEETHYTNITVKITTDKGRLIYFYFMHP